MTRSSGQAPEAYTLHRATATQAVPPQDAVFDDAVFDKALDYGLDQEEVTETAVESPKIGMAARNACNRKQPEKYPKHAR